MPRPSERDFELLDMPTVSSQLPVRFDNGAEWDKFKGECQGCGRELPDDALHGAVVRQTASMYSIEASGVCTDCMLLTRFVFRLYDDMRITGPRGGQWLTWGGKSKSLWSRICSALQI